MNGYFRDFTGVFFKDDDLENKVTLEVGQCHQKSHQFCHNDIIHIV